MDKHALSDVTRDDSQRRFLAQHRVTTLYQHRNDALRINHRSECSSLTSP